MLGGNNTKVLTHFRLKQMENAAIDFSLSYADRSARFCRTPQISYLYRPSLTGTGAQMGSYQLLPHREWGFLFMISIKSRLLPKAQGLTNSLPKSNVSVPGSINNELVRSCAGKWEGVKKPHTSFNFHLYPSAWGVTGGRKVEGCDL